MTSTVIFLLILLSSANGKGPKGAKKEPPHKKGWKCITNIILLLELL